MDPPAYTTAQPHRTIEDLRAQIIANGSVMRNSGNGDRASDDHIEVLLAKVSEAKPRASSSRVDEKQAMRDAVNGVPKAGKHYAMLIRRSSGRTVYIILKGEPKDTVEEALEWLLEKTEVAIHELVEKHGKMYDEAECCVM